jgi:hypothetical protein
MREYLLAGRALARPCACTLARTIVAISTEGAHAHAYLHARVGSGPAAQPCDHKVISRKRMRGRGLYSRMRTRSIAYTRTPHARSYVGSSAACADVLAHAQSRKYARSLTTFTTNSFLIGRPAPGAKLRPLWEKDGLFMSSFAGKGLTSQSQAWSVESLSKKMGGSCGFEPGEDLGRGRLAVPPFPGATRTETCTA